MMQMMGHMTGFSYVGSSREELLGFNSSLGFPGEGPGQGPGVEILLGTINVTVWSTLVAAKILGGRAGAGAAAWAIQETKLHKPDDLNKAASGVQAGGWAMAADTAVITEKLGVSAGVAVAWDRSIGSREVGKAMKCSGVGRWCLQHLQLLRRLQ